MRAAVLKGACKLLANHAVDDYAWVTICSTLLVQYTALRASKTANSKPWVNCLLDRSTQDWFVTLIRHIPLKNDDGLC